MKWVRRRLCWHDREPPERELIVVIGLSVVLLAVFLVGCRAPQPIRTHSPHLTELREFQLCITGPWSTIWLREAAAVKDDTACGQFNVLVLPRACEAFDFDGDRDVDLKDFAIWMTARG